MKRALILFFALCLLLSSCTSEPLPEPAVTVCATEELTYPSGTEDSDEETDEADTTAEIGITTPAEETTEMPGIEILNASELLQLSEILTVSYNSFVRITHTETDIDILGEETHTNTDSELRLKDGNAVFRVGSDGEFEHVYLVNSDIYREGGLAKYRIGGYDKKKFLSEFCEIIPLSLFTDGSTERTENEILLKFTSISEAGISLIRSTFELDDEYSITIERSELSLRLDSMAHMQESRIELSLSVGTEEEEVMSLSIVSESRQSDVNSDIHLELPRAADFIYFRDLDSALLYEKLCAEITGFTSSHSKFEYTLRDDMHIKSDNTDLPLTSFSTYAYDSRIGASIEKAFDIADGTGPHRTLTHYNNRRGFSQIDGGSIFVDTTVNKNNLEYTLSRPFSTSFFKIGNCSQMDITRSTDSRLAFTLNENTAKSIAADLLLRAGIIASPEISSVTAFTYIDKGDNGRISAIGYEFTANAEVSGKIFSLSRNVRLEIVSDNSANVKVIYIDIEDDEE